MTEREALKLSLDLLEKLQSVFDVPAAEEAITAIKEALAQPEKNYATTRNAWTGKATHKCNVCGRDDFRSEHAAKFHTCEALAQPEQEPVAWMHPDGRLWTFGRGFDKSTFTVPLYTTPPQRKPLTDEMRKQMKERCDSMEMRGAFADGWLSAEAAHNIKE